MSSSKHSKSLLDYNETRKDLFTSIEDFKAILDSGFCIKPAVDNSFCNKGYSTLTERIGFLIFIN